jgi:hypothetical protein
LSSRYIYDVIKSEQGLSMSQNPTQKRGRPRVDALAVTVRLHPEHLSILDRWIAEQPDKPGRPEAIRRLLRQVLDSSVTKE